MRSGCSSYIKTQVANCLMRRMMIDEGSRAESMFLDAFKQLNNSHIKPSRAPLNGFEGTKTWPMREITLLVTIVDKTVEVDFVVVDKPSSYNTIVGRDWMHKMETEASSPYHVVKFPSREENNITSNRGHRLCQKGFMELRSRVKTLPRMKNKKCEHNNK